MIYIYLTVWVWSESSFHVDVNWQTLAYLIIFTDSIININLSIFTDSIINPSWTEHIADSSLGSGSKNEDLNQSLTGCLYIFLIALCSITRRVVRVRLELKLYSRDGTFKLELMNWLPFTLTFKTSFIQKWAL